MTGEWCDDWKAVVVDLICRLLLMWSMVHFWAVVFLSVFSQGAFSSVLSLVFSGVAEADWSFPLVVAAG